MKCLHESSDVCKEKVRRAIEDVNGKQNPVHCSKRPVFCMIRSLQTNFIVIRKEGASAAPLPARRRAAPPQCEQSPPSTPRRAKPAPGRRPWPDRPGGRGHHPQAAGREGGTLLRGREGGRSPPSHRLAARIHPAVLAVCTHLLDTGEGVSTSNDLT